MTIHGLLANHTVYYRCGAKTLADAGYRVVMYDQRGHGLSQSSERGYTLEEMAEDLLDVMDALLIDQVDLIGYSYGGATAIQAALMAPERFKSLILIEPSGLMGAVLDQFTGDEDWVNRYLEDYTASTGVFISERERQQFTKRVNMLLQSGLLEALYQNRDFIVRADLSRITCPTLVLCGTESEAYQDSLLAAHRIPHARIERTKADHFLPTTQPNWVKHHLVTQIQYTNEIDQWVKPVPSSSDTRSELTEGEADEADEADEVDETDDTDEVSTNREHIAIQVRNLSMSYGSVQAVRGINLDVPDGAFFAFLGMNGAGKSTTIKCLTTLLRPTGGSARISGYVLGQENDAIRHNIGVVFQSALLDPRLSVKENLEVRTKLHRISRAKSNSRIDELITLLGMSSFAKRAYSQLSGGQKRRADIARALVHQPSVLFLDEPTAGLDPYGREQVWQAITDVRQHEGVTVFLTTHYMAETERADMVCIIDEGKIIIQGTPADLREKYSHSELSVRLRDEDAGLRLLARFFPYVKVPTSWTPGEVLRLPIESIEQFKHIVPYLWDLLDDLEFRHGSMDEVFLQLTGHHASTEAADERVRTRSRSKVSFKGKRGLA